MSFCLWGPAQHVEKDDVTRSYIIDSLGRKQLTFFINESGLYSLILSSKLESAKRFKHWVTSEVLPAIRKQSGQYMLYAEFACQGFAKSRTHKRVLNPGIGITRKRNGVQTHFE